VVLRTQTDARLTALARDGSPQAFTAIIERYGRELRTHAGRIVRRDRAEDVVQQAMLGAWSALLDGREVEDIRAWLHRIVHNTALSTVARRGYDDGELPPSAAAPGLTEDLVERRVSAVQALAEIAALPEPQRRALTMTALEGRSGRETARSLGVSESAVRQLVHRARNGLRSASTAMVPVPLISWAVRGTGGSATPMAVSLGAAGSGGAVLAKAAVVIGVGATALGAGHALRSHPHAPPGQRTSGSAGEAAALGPGDRTATLRASRLMAVTPPGGPSSSRHGQASARWDGAGPRGQRSGPGAQHRAGSGRQAGGQGQRQASDESSRAGADGRSGDGRSGDGGSSVTGPSQTTDRPAGEPERSSGSKTEATRPAASSESASSHAAHGDRTSSSADHVSSPDGSPAARSEPSPSLAPGAETDLASP
jgi:RNA polymerase sigma factor (sigma-70 family)